MEAFNPNATRVIFDIETDGLIDEMTRLLVAVVYDYSSGEYFRYHRQDAQLFLEHLNCADVIIGHNIIDFDVEALRVLFGWTPPSHCELFDTLVATRCIWSNIKETDFGKWKRNKLPGKMIGRHSLEAWGHRLGAYKDTSFKEADWSSLDENNQELMEYCVKDCEVTYALFRKIQESKYPEWPLYIDMESAKLLRQQKTTGFPFNVDKAYELNAELQSRRSALKSTMLDMVGNLVFPQGEFTPKRSNSRLGYVEGAKLTKVTFKEFDPGSGDHIVSALGKLYDWEPTRFTDKGNPKVDEDTLSELDQEEYPLVVPLLEWLVVNKRLEQIADGDGAWLKNVYRDANGNGRIHHTCLASGTVTGRSSHKGPNLGQVPSPRKPYGDRCRELFTCDPGFTMIGADLEGIELRCLAHYLARWDNGEFGRELLEGDIHWKNAIALGLVEPGTECNKENNSYHKWARDEVAKRFIYAFLYGAGPEKIGFIMNAGAKKGKELRNKFLAMMPAIGQLETALEYKVNKKGYIVGLDGRRLPIRSKHSALNTLLQAAGGAIAKHWMWITNERIRDAGYDWNTIAQLAYVHDELQYQCVEGEEDTLKKILTEAATDAGEFLGYRMPVDIGIDEGKTWLDTH